MIYHFEFFRDGDGYWGECKELEGCLSEGNTMDELKVNLEEALEAVLESYNAHDLKYSLPDPTLDKNPNLLQIKVSPDVAFMVQLRTYRHRKKLTQNQMKDALGMKSRNSYVKLEKKGNPTFKTAGRIIMTFPDFPIGKCF